MVGVNDHEQPVAVRPSEQNIPLFLVGMNVVGQRQGQRIPERRRSLVEVDAVLAKVRGFFLGIPGELHHRPVGGARSRADPWRTVTVRGPLLRRSLVLSIVP